MFIELTSPPALREWLPKLVGVGRSVALRVGDTLVRAEPEGSHASQLTRSEITAAVHYIRWSLTDEEVRAFASEPLALVLDHPSYAYEVALAEDARDDLRVDLSGGS
jgi:hypothetical protein